MCLLLTVCYACGSAQDPMWQQLDDDIDLEDAPVDGEAVIRTPKPKRKKLRSSPAKTEEAETWVHL